MLAFFWIFDEKLIFWHIRFWPSFQLSCHFDFLPCLKLFAIFQIFSHFSDFRPSLKFLIGSEIFKPFTNFWPLWFFGILDFLRFSEILNFFEKWEFHFYFCQNFDFSLNFRSWSTYFQISFLKSGLFGVLKVFIESFNWLHVETTLKIHVNYFKWHFDLWNIYFLFLGLSPEKKFFFHRFFSTNLTFSLLWFYECGTVALIQPNYGKNIIPVDLENIKTENHYRSNWTQ